MENFNDLNTELRSILETEGALTDEQVARVDEIEARLAELETEARSADARAKAEARLSKGSFSGGSVKVADTRSQIERFADWAIGGDTRALGVASDSALVPLDLQNELVTILGGVSAARKAVDVRTYGYDVEIARVASRPTIIDFTGEAVAYDDVESTFDKVRSYAFKSAAETTISEELMQDSRPAVLNEILEAQMAAHGLFWDAQYLRDGAGTTNGPEKIFDATVTGLNTSESAAIDTIALDDLYAAWFEALPAQYRGGNFSWVMHPTVESVLRREEDTTGRKLLLPQATGTDAGNGVMGTSILGLPVHVSTQAPTYAAAQASGNVPAVMLIEKNSYRIFDRMPLMTQRDEYSKGSTGQVVFRSKMRSDGRWLAPWTSVGITLKQA